jgi:carboxymethylenebutenolidase
MADALELTAQDGHKFLAYVAGAADQQRAIVLIDAIPGNTAYVRRLAERIAAYGFRVLVPYLLDRAQPGLLLTYRPPDRARAEALRAGLGGRAAMADLAATIAAASPASVGILGFGWGATVAWHAAHRLNALRAAVCFYPGAGVAENRQQRPLCPVRLVFAEGDLDVPLADVESIRRAQPGVDVVIYPIVSRNFACEELEAYNFEAWENARDHLVAFFNRHL